ncbi:MAG: hypothetical protein IKW02_01865 [Clostridia bacterium]|nr:hypothetical protein [Clostridia bacterium]
MSPIKSLALFIILLLTFSFPANADSEVFSPAGDVAELITATSFTDSAEISASVQAETFVALGLMYHSTGGKFLPAENLTNALALRLVFRTVNKVEEAEALAYNSAERQAAGLGEYDDLSWADGYYILALKEGMLSEEQFNDAYTNPESSLARDGLVSAQNMIKWLTVAHKVILSDFSLPARTNIHPDYRIYYSSLYKYGFLTADDIRYFSELDLLTRNDTVVLLEKFEKYILNCLDAKSHSGRITDIKIDFNGNKYVRRINYKVGTKEYSLELTGENIASPIADISGETIVFGKGQPDISGVLRTGDEIKVYYKGSTLLFVRVLDYKVDEEYRPSPHNYRGKLYFFDPTDKTITLDISGNLKSFYISDSLQAYHATEEISMNRLLNDSFDKDCIIYADAPIYGGLYRVYSVITN